MINCIIFDIDGTLRDEKNGVHPSSIKAIQQCRANGIYVGICTGRTYASIQDDIHAITFDFVISGDGSQIRMNQTILQDLYISKDTIADIQQQITNEMGYAVETDHFIYMNKQACQILTKQNQQKGTLHNAFEKIIYRDTIQAFQVQTMPASKLCIWSKQPFPKRYDVLYTQWKQHPDYYYEMVHPLAGKQNAIEILKQHLHLTSELLLCFGDGKNDIGMFNACGQRVAMKQGVQELINMADSICEQPDQIYYELIKRKVI